MTYLLEVLNVARSNYINKIGWMSLGVGIAAVGLYVGRELCDLYQFRHRSPYDFYSHAGDEEMSDLVPAEAGVGV
jgi:hypothetical protein